MKDAEIYEDSAIFFLSDHGDFTGDYDLVEKAQNSFEDCLTKVPLLIKPPSWIETDSGITSALTELVDFYATVMELAGVEPSHTHFGKSLVPVLANRRVKNRDYVFCEGGRMANEIHCDEFHETGEAGMSQRVAYWPKVKAQTEPVAHAKGIMIRNDQYKYVSRTLGMDEFYDLAADPGERINQIENAKYKDIITQLKMEMLKWLQATADVVPYQMDKRFNNQMILAKAKALANEEDYPRIEEMVKNGESFLNVMQFARESNGKHH